MPALRLIAVAALLVPSALAAVPPGPDPLPRTPAQVIFEQLERRPVVAFLETHGAADQHEFLRALVADPEFGRHVDDIVVEFGSARYQVTIDRYVRGERVPAASLSRVWSRTTQTSGVWGHPIYQRFFTAVRAANAGRPPAERVRVLLGDPPIDWRRIRRSTCPRRPNPACLDYWISRRTAHYAGVVLAKVLARGRRALVIAGAFHLVRPPSGGVQNETGIIERRHPGSVFTVKPHEAFGGSDGAELERRLAGWPVPSLAVSRGTWLGALDPGLAFGAGPGSEHPLLRGRLEDRIDGYLYLG